MLKIDAHQHFWKFDPVRDSWIDKSMAAIQRDFLPDDLAPLLAAHGITGCVAVQADQSEAETDFLLQQSNSRSFIKCIVGWVDLRAPNIAERLDYYSQFAKIKGFRHVLQSEADRAFMLSPQFVNGISALANHNYSYDILILPDQLGFTHQLVKAFPNQRFVIDHIAKPDIKNQEIEKWAAGIKTIAACPNAYCKVSGMVTEANWLNWVYEDFEPYLDVVFEAFGAQRLMFGSDWPVCNVAGGFDKTISTVKHYVDKLSVNEQAHFWGLSAEGFYNL